MTSAAPEHRVIRVAGTQAGVEGAVEAFRQFRAACGVHKDSVWQLELALDEILTNIVTHGYRHRADGWIDLTFVMDEGELEITIEDTAPALDPLAVPPPDLTAPLSERQTGGLGVHLVKSLMDRVEYGRRNGRNCLTLARRISR